MTQYTSPLNLVSLFYQFTPALFSFISCFISCSIFVLFRAKVNSEIYFNATSWSPLQLQNYWICLRRVRLSDPFSV